MVTKKVSAGSFDLNKFLFGGFESDIISTVYGPGGSGKSNIVMIAAVSQAKKGNKVVFVDTEGSFSSDRFRQIHGGDRDSFERDLSNVLLLNPTSFDEQEKAFSQLLGFVKRDSISLIVVDSIAMLYRLELGAAISSDDRSRIGVINRKLADQLRSLTEIARKQNIPVVVTNQVYSLFNSDDESKRIERELSMVGGDLLKYWSKCLIELQNRGGRRKLILRKHRSLPVKEMGFEIVESGIRKKGLF